MRCAVHTDVDAVGYCRNCGKAMCAACVRPVRDVFYCEDCLATVMGIPAPAPAPSPYSTETNPAGYTPPAAQPVTPVQTATSPAIAFVLGLVPGLGAIYNGEYNKALIHIVVFATIIFGVSSDISGGAEVLLALAIPGFILYMAVDAMRTAKAKQLGQTSVDPIEAWSRNRPIGPILLIGFGGLLLLNNFHIFPFHRLVQLWPLVLIGAGILMFRNRLTNGS
ncbi:MAG TPA: B-box zinc finger protein [Candidatus Saccharimonadales bacterium]|nr:B-box zinc finger protein [Candidatus Saccharimonadales bacterium]